MDLKHAKMGKSGTTISINAVIRAGVVINLSSQQTMEENVVRERVLTGNGAEDSHGLHTRACKLYFIFSSFFFATHLLRVQAQVMDKVAVDQVEAGLVAIGTILIKQNCSSQKKKKRKMKKKKKKKTKLPRLTS